MDFNYEEIFKFSLRALRLNKSHPAVKRDKKWILHFLLRHGIFTTVFILLMYNIIFHNLKSNDFNQTCKNGILSVVFLTVTFMYSILLWKQDLLLNLMTLVKADYQRAKFLPENEQEIMSKFVIQGAYVSKQWLIIAISGYGVFPLKNVILLTYYWAIGEPQLIPLYDLIYPRIIEEKKDSIFVYLVTYAMMLFYGMYAMLMYTAFIPLGPSFMLHACGQLEIVEKNIERLYGGGEDEIEKRLEEVIKQLQYIYSFVEQIQLSFCVSYELTLKASTILLPITCYEIIEAFHKGEVPLEFFTFVVGGVLLSSSPCYYSDLLMEKGEKVRLAMYSCGWEDVYNTKIRSTIRIVQMRALKPVAIRTLFNDVSLQALTDLFQQSYTIFNLMNAMWK